VTNKTSTDVDMQLIPMDTAAITLPAIAIARHPSILVSPAANGPARNKLYVSSTLCDASLYGS
jgi:hypothetical protein